MPEAPSSSSAEATRSGSLAPVATTTSAPAVSSVETAVRRAARETTTVSGTSGAMRTRFEVTGRRAVVSKTMRRGWRAASGGRAVSWGSSRSAVPMPTATASQPARQRWPSSRLAAGDPLGVAGLGGDLAVEGHGRLEQHPRAPRARVLAEGLVELARAGGELALGHDDLDAVVAQDPQAAAGGLLGGVVGGDDHAADAGRAIASVHGGVRPSWQQGSSETYIVAPLRSVSPASAIAATSACGPPSIACQPSPTTSPSLTTTAPASGLGDVTPTTLCERDRSLEVQVVGIGGRDTEADGSCTRQCSGTTSPPDKWDPGADDDPRPPGGGAAVTCSRPRMVGGRRRIGVHRRPAGRGDHAGRSARGRGALAVPALRSRRERAHSACRAAARRRPAPRAAHRPVAVRRHQPAAADALRAAELPRRDRGRDADADVAVAGHAADRLAGGRALCGARRCGRRAGG